MMDEHTKIRVSIAVAAGFGLLIVWVFFQIAAVLS